ncbi:hypothetical protein [Psychroserpens mesophilus]|uniref:hypothetical protein n=1 Tax=Psychroserpens mesophilus TaxID=325473 RepID=UPI003D6628E8
MESEINSIGKWITYSYITQDESYMIYDFKSDLGFGDSDLYISFNKSGKWAKTNNFGSKITTDQTEMATSVSIDD